MQNSSVFATLSIINVDDQLEWKENLAYLNWARSLRLLLEKYPDATHEIVRFPDDQGRDVLPFLKTEIGYFVEVAVTVEGIRKSCLHPVLDEGFNPIYEPTPFEISNSCQRALAKAIAMHGLALYVYGNESSPSMVIPTNEEPPKCEPTAEFLHLEACEGNNQQPYFIATFQEGQETFKAAIFGDMIGVLETLKVGDRCVVATKELKGRLAVQELRKVA